MKRALPFALLVSACAHGTLLDVALDDLPRQSSIAVEDVSDSDGMSDSEGLAEELRRTRLFDRVDRVAVVGEADLAVRGTVERDCDHDSLAENGSLLVAFVSLIGGGLGTLLAIPQIDAGDGGLIALTYALATAGGVGLWLGWNAATSGHYSCTVSSDLTVYRGARPWRRYREQGTMQLGDQPSTPVMMHLLARRLTARLVNDLERGEVQP